MIAEVPAPIRLVLPKVTRREQFAVACVSERGFRCGYSPGMNGKNGRLRISALKIQPHYGVTAFLNFASRQKSPGCAFEHGFREDFIEILQYTLDTGGG